MDHLSLGAGDGQRLAWFALGRNAMYAACQLLGLQEGDEVLTPAFDCDGALQPFRMLGLRLAFYRSDPATLAADLEDIRRRLTPRTRLLHVINHFGFPQPWGRLLAWRHDTGIPILEDNAYTLLSEFSGRPAGTFGDAAIFSLRKTLGLVDGGVLRLNRADLRWSPLFRRTPWIGWPERPQALKLLLRRLGYGSLPAEWRNRIRRASGSEPAPPPLYDHPARGVPWRPARDAIGPEFACDPLRPMSRLARRQLAAYTPVRLEAIAGARRVHYARVAAALQGLPGLQVLWPELPEGIVPFCLNLLVETQRDLMLVHLQRRFSVMAWPTLPHEVIEQLPEFPEVERLGRQLLQVTLPAESVREAGYGCHLGEFVRDVTALARQHLSPRSTASLEPSWTAAG